MTLRLASLSQGLPGLGYCVEEPAPRDCGEKDFLLYLSNVWFVGGAFLFGPL